VRWQEPIERVPRGGGEILKSGRGRSLREALGIVAETHAGRRLRETLVTIEQSLLLAQ